MSDKGKIKELREKRAKLVADQRAILDKASAEKRGLTADEDQNYQNMEKEFDTLTADINKMVSEAETQRAAELREADLKKKESLLKSSQAHPIKPDPNLENRAKTEKKFAQYDIEKRYQVAVDRYRIQTDGRYSEQEYLDACRRYLIYGDKGITAEQKTMIESRALQADSDTIGGYLVSPEKLIMDLIRKLDNMVFVRQYARVWPLPDAATMGVPALDQRMGDMEWTAEIRTGSEDSTLSFDKRSLTPHPLARRIKVSKTLLRKALINVEEIVSQEFAYNFRIVTENAYLNGSGVNKPLGVFTASDAGISTARDCSTGNTTTAIVADGLINCKYFMEKQYRQNLSCRWAFHRDGVKMIRKLKDGEGNYLWKQGLSDRPDTILEIPYEESEYVPSTFTTGKYVGILGDWNFYWIADCLNMQIQVLTELYAETNQNGYIARYEGDGMPVLEQAFVRVKLAQ